MRYLIIITSLLFLSSFALSNDGAFYVNGNHLIPLQENQIELKKEILTITRQNDNTVLVNVEYTLNNLGKEKTIVVGFEASSPSGDVDATPLNGGHPNIQRFDVIMNGGALPHQIAIIEDSNYFNNGQIKSYNVDQVVTRDFDPNYAEFGYVYYFQAKFRPGINTIQHSYQYTLGSSVMSEYEFGYVLTTANRWANKQIDDFTLEMDFGSYQKLTLSQDFYDSHSEWDFNGSVSEVKGVKWGDEDAVWNYFYISGGKFTLHKLNYHPKGEISLWCDAHHLVFDTFDRKEHQLKFMISHSLFTKMSSDELSFKILRNLPFARRGYTFKTSEIQHYYESLPWYKPDPSYEATTASLTEEEVEWLKIVRSNKWNGSTEQD